MFNMTNKTSPLSTLLKGIDCRCQIDQATVPNGGIGIHGACRGQIS